MRTVCLVLLTALGSGLQSQAALQIENAALRHQLAVLQRQARGRPQLRTIDRLFWAWLCRLWPGWRRAALLHEYRSSVHLPRPSDCHDPIANEAGRPSMVIRFKMLHAITASASCASEPGFPIWLWYFYPSE